MQPSTLAPMSISEGSSQTMWLLTFPAASLEVAVAAALAAVGVAVAGVGAMSTLCGTCWLGLLQVQQQCLQHTL